MHWFFIELENFYLRAILGPFWHQNFKTEFPGKNHPINFKCSFYWTLRKKSKTPFILFFVKIWKTLFRTLFGPFLTQKPQIKIFSKKVRPFVFVTSYKKSEKLHKLIFDKNIIFAYFRPFCLKIC